MRAPLTQGIYVRVITAADKLSPSASCPTAHLNQGLGPQPPGRVAAAREPRPAVGPAAAPFPACPPPCSWAQVLSAQPPTPPPPSGAGLRGAVRLCPTGGRGQAGLGGGESRLLGPGVWWRRSGVLSLWTSPGGAEEEGWSCRPASGLWAVRPGLCGWWSEAICEWRSLLRSEN